MKKRFSKEAIFLTDEENNHSFLGWGRKDSGRKAVSKAEKQARPFLLLEDGFIRCLGREDDSLSLVVDNKGIYYDCREPSQLEDLISEPLSESEKDRAHNLIQKWKRQRVSKYNGTPDYAGALPSRYVLVFDQVHGDLSVVFGGADTHSFRQMLKKALEDNPESHVIVKVHPDVLTRQKEGYFNLDDLRKNPKIIIIAENCHPVRLIEHAERIYVVTSQTGFEALLWGKEVHVFGMPFYAGWGLTNDMLPTPLRRSLVSLEQLVIGSLVKYSRYVHPETKSQCIPEAIMDYVYLQRQMRVRFHTQIYALGFSQWKQPILRQFLQGSDVEFITSEQDVPNDATLALWGSAEHRLPSSTTILRIEDGFLRSSGLGADLIHPLSWVIDDVGIYYDSSQSSRLEDILETTDFSLSLLEQARALRSQLLEKEVTKYNLFGKPWMRPSGDKQVILVPGQVESDASIRHGTRTINTNMALLKAVRVKYKDAYIIYKPHPDVVAGLRLTGQGEEQAAQYCNEIAEKVDLHTLLVHVDEVHTMTSLLGFEALIRGVPVTCYGQPFYSGWGLTNDIIPNTRRTRSLTLDELIAGALIIYPTYISRITKNFTTPENAIEELAVWRKQGPSTRTLRQKSLRVFLRLWAQLGIRKNA